MKRVTEIECKSMPIGKARERLLRSRNKRKCKRKKNARTFKRFCSLKEAGIHYTAGSYQRRDQIHRSSQPYSEGGEPGAEVRLKHAQNVWIRTYQRIVKWHGKHQLNYWRQCAHQLKAENDRLKRVMLTTRPLQNDHEMDSDEDYPYADDPYGDTEDENADEFEANKGSRQRYCWQQTSATDNHRAEPPPEEEELDEEFLAFMEVSARHRLEHRRLKNESVH
ncbi:uncharacterized protein LOC126565381 [Anopheles maculipalpis]|uniref:uncharacterized protein LOC126565381 n=1 Tax=Anopheles maculipalpis TaxID=1496333 RepID=UPI002158B415|nr:uncharacterized protein LOC126565381 [Anopheles maculipalpis]